MGGKVEHNAECRDDLLSKTFFFECLMVKKLKQADYIIVRLKHIAIASTIRQTGKQTNKKAT